MCLKQLSKQLTKIKFCVRLFRVDTLKGGRGISVSCLSWNEATKGSKVKILFFMQLFS